MPLHVLGRWGPTGDARERRDRLAGPASGGPATVRNIFFLSAAAGDDAAQAQRRGVNGRAG
jgi:hypothetical protein